MPVRGNSVERVRRDLKKKINEITGTRTEAAVYAILSQGAALAAIMTPVDTSTLINSQYAPQVSNDGKKTSGHVGYTASYAQWVHEAPGVLKGLPRSNGNGNYWDPQGEPEFLSKGFEQLKSSIPQILKGIYRV